MKLLTTAKSFPSWVGLLSIAACGVVAPFSSAQTYTWNGGSIFSDNWNDAGNWTSILAPPTQPMAFNDNLDFIFTGTKADSVVDVDWIVTSLTFNSGVPAMTFTGEDLTVRTDGISNFDASTQTFDNSSVIFAAHSVPGGDDISISATSGDLDFNAPVSVSDELTLNITGANDVFFDGGITSFDPTAETMALNKNNLGILRLQGNATAMEELNVNSGTLSLSSSPVLNSAVNVFVGGGATFDMNGNNINIDRLTGSGSVVTDGGTLTVGDSADFTWEGFSSGTGGLTKDQTNVMTVTQTQTYTGATNITAGTLRLQGSGGLDGATDLSISSGATFDVNGVADTVDSISGAGTILLGGGFLIVDEAAGTRTFSGNIQETGTFQKSGGGTLLLSGTNNTMSSLVVNGGVLQVNNAGALGAGTVAITNATLQTTASLTSARSITLGGAATFNVNNATTFTQNAVINGAGSLNKQGNGTLELAVSNSYSGDTNIADGIVRLLAANRIDNESDLTLIAGATLQLNNFAETVASISGTGGSVITGGANGRLTVNAPSGTLTYSGTFTGSGGLNKQGNHTLILGGNNTNSGATNITGGILRLTGSGGLGDNSDVTVTGATWDLNGVSDTVDSINSSGSILLGGATLTVDEGGSATRTFSGAISEAGALVKSGTHTLVLSGNNTYTGTTTIDGGVLRVGGNSNLGAGNLFFNSGTLNTTATFTNARSLQISASNSATIDVNSATTLTQGSIIDGNTTTTLIKQGGGTFIWSVDSGLLFQGDILVSNGTFDHSTGDASTSTTVTVNSPGVFLVNHVDLLDGLQGNGSVVLNNDLSVGNGNATTTFSGVISGTGDLVKGGTGTLTLSGINTFTGMTGIEGGGVLRLDTGGQLSDMTFVAVLAGSTFDLNNVSDAIDALGGGGAVTLGAGTNNTLTIGSNNGGSVFSGTISGTGNFVKVGAGTQTLTGNNTWTNGTQINGGVLRITNTFTNLGTGSIQFDGGTLETTATGSNFKGFVLNAGGGTINVDAGTTLTMAAGTPVSGVGSLTKEDNGTLVLTASNTYTGDTIINDGLLQYSAVATQLSDLTDVIVAGGADWDLNGHSDTVKSISGAGDIFLGGGTLTVNQDGGSTTFSGDIEEAGGLTKNGTHTLVLSGSNSYSGPTTINGGVISISNDGNLGSPTGNLVFNGGTLETTVTQTSSRNVTLLAGGGTLATTGGLNVTTWTGDVSGSGTLIKGGATIGGLILTGNNSYQGGTIVNAGAVTVSSNANLGANSGTVTLVGGTRLNIAGTFTNLHAIVLDNGGDISVGSGLTLTQAVGISGTGTLIKNGTGTLLLTAPATHAGDTIINAGTLQFGSGELPDDYDVTVDGSTDVWDLNGVSDTIDGLFGAGTVLLGGGTLTVGNADGDGDFSGSILESGAFVKTGSGLQVLSGANTYTASTVIDEGTLQITDNNSLGALSAELAFNDGTLRTTTTFSTGRTTTINSEGIFDVAPATTLTFTSPIGGFGGLTKTNDGVLELSQPNTYAGFTDIVDGTLRLVGTGQLNNITDVQVAAGATFDLTNLSDAIDSLLGSGEVILGTGTLTIGSDNGGGTFGGVISGTGLAGTVVKQGAGTAIFSGANTYAGGTHINGGVLQISNNVNLGAAGGQVLFNTGTLHTTDNIVTVREMSLGVGGGTIDVDGGTTLAAGGNIAGAGSLSKIGLGILELGGISSYASTNIFGGVLSAGFNFNLGTEFGPLNIDGGTLRTTNLFTTSRLTTLGSGGATFEVDPLTTHTHNGVIQGNTGAAGFAKTGSGTLRFTGVNTFVGALHLHAGVLQVNLSNQLGNGSNTFQFHGGTLATLGTFTNARLMYLNAGGGTVEVLGGTTFTQSGIIDDGPAGPAGQLSKTGAGILRLTASNLFTSPVNVQSGTLQLLGAGRLPDTADVAVAMPAALDLNGVSDAIDALSGDGDVLLGGGTLTVGASDGGATFSGVISETGGLTKVGAGTQLLRTKMVGMDTFPNTYSGSTMINGGTLDIEEDSNLGNAAGGLSFDGGTLQAVGDHSISTSRAVTLDAGGGTLSTVGLDASMNFAGVISGPGSLTKTGQGLLTLAAANIYTGDTVINGGTVRLNGAGRLPDASTVHVNVATSGGNFQGLQLNNISDAVNGLNGNGEIELGTGTLTVGSAGGGGTFGGVIEGTGGVVKIGAGTQVVSGNNIYSGGTSINGGVLQVPNNASLGNVAGSLAFNGGTLRTTASFAMSRTTTLNAGGGTFDAATGTTLSHAAQISGAGGLGKTGGGTLSLSGVNIYGGPTTVADGILRIVGAERLPNSTSLTVDAPGVFDLNNNNETIDGLTGAGTVQLGSAQLTVGISGGSGNFSGVISGSGDFQKEGAGTQVLSGAHTFDGATVVNSGELVLNAGGTIAQTTLSVGFNNGSDGAVTIAGPATTWDLTGNLNVGVAGDGLLQINNGSVVTVGGQVAIGLGGGEGTITLDGGTLDNSAGTTILVANGQLGGEGVILGDVVSQDVVAPGTSTGILNVTGTYVQQTGSTFAAEIGGTVAGQFDLLAVTGTGALGGTLELALASFTPNPSDTFAILSAGSLVGSFGNVASGARLNISSGGTGSFQVNYGPGSPFGANQVVLSDFIGSASYSADFDGDGDVDGDDLDDWELAYGVDDSADADGDGDSDGLDFLSWQQQFGSGLPPLAASQVVPEPVTFGPFLVALASLIVTRPRRWHAPRRSVCA